MKGISVRILSVLVTLAAAHAARAEYLYWMIDGNNLALEGEPFGDYAYARVKDLQTGTYLSVYDASGSKTSATAVNKVTAISGPMVWGDFEADNSSSVSTFSSSEKSISSFPLRKSRSCSNSTTATVMSLLGSRCRLLNLLPSDTSATASIRRSPLIC